MLALMCNLYRGAGFIPRNRPEVYKKCSEMLFERWDPSRGIWVHLPVSEPKVLLGHLAHWVYSDESLQSGVTEDQLIRQSAKYLYPRRFEIEEEAEQASGQFIEFCRGRAWVFTDAGTTADGVYLYKFTHKTFLEYFAALHLVRNNNTADALWSSLQGKIAARAWDVVAQLAFQILHEQVEGASDQLLSFLLDGAQRTSKLQWPFLSFGARCLAFMYPSPRSTRALTGASVQCIVAGGYLRPSKRHKARWYEGEREAELVSALLSCATECRPTVEDSLKTEIVRLASSDNKKTAVRAVDLGLTLSWPLRFEHRRPVDETLLNYWEAVRKTIAQSLEGRLRSFAPQDFLSFMHYRDMQKAGVAQLLQWHTPDHLFLHLRHPVFGYRRWPIALELLKFVPCLDQPVEEEISQQLRQALAELSSVGTFFMNERLPCLTAAAVESGVVSDFEFVLDRWHRMVPAQEESPRVNVPTPSGATIGIWCLSAPIAEVVPKPEQLVELLRKAPSRSVKVICDLIEARVHKLDFSEPLRRLQTLDGPENALRMIEQWVSGEISMVRASSPFNKKHIL
jgi:hypothetical protein